MAFFTVYVDDSGTDPKQFVANASALIIPAARIIALESEWEKFKSKEQFCDFHTSEFVARNAKSYFANWSEAKQKRVFARVRQIIKKYGAKVWSFSVDKDEYDSVVPSEFRKYSGKQHYTWALRHVLTWLEKWRSSNQAQPFEFVFDYQKPKDECRREIENVMDYAEREASERGASGLFVNYGFRPRKDFAGLQCVDLLAWMSYRYALFGFRKTPLHPFAEIAWRDFVPAGTDAGPGDWLTALILKKAALQDWVAKETASGESLSRFQRWEQEDKAKDERKNRI